MVAIDDLEVPVNLLYPVLKEIKFWLTKIKSRKVVPDYTELMSQWKNVLKNGSSHITREDSKHVLFVTGYGLGSHYYLIEPILINSLRQRGAKISSLVCAKSLPACELNKNGNNKPKAPLIAREGIFNSTITSKCNSCTENVTHVLNELGVATHKMSVYITNDDYKRAESIVKDIDLKKFRSFEFEGISVGEEAFASILRATFKGQIGDAPADEALKKRYLLAGILTTIAYINAFSTLKPDKIVCIHGIYQIHGLAVKVANKLNIPIDVIGGGGIRKNTIIACHGETYHHQLINEDNSIWNKRTLSEDEVKQTLKYAEAKRTSGAGVDYLSYHPSPIEDESKLISSLNIDKRTKIVAVYTNVIWDAQVVYSSNVFDDIFDWLWTTIDAAALNKNITLVVRIHPAETRGGIPTKQPMLNEIYKRYPVLPANIRVIPPSSDLSSYTLASLAALNIIYGTKMGLEIALLKSPLIVAGETFSRNKGYGYDVKSKDKYVKILQNIESFVQHYDEDQCFDTAVKYAHYLYFRRMLDLPLLSTKEKSGYQTSLSFISLDFLRPKNMKTLDVICDGILDDKKFYIQ
ncbi:hypothetical protein [Roseobacter sp. HKCCD5988]|uniref:hypothetical protein n=1 Tax=Roseobacter sp. HKCCD5988 TaxID=3120338 RepID=UPI0030ED7F0C